MIRKVSTDSLTGNVRVVFVSPSGRVTDKTLPMTEATFRSAHADWKDGTLIQNAFPALDADDRELLMTGIGPKEWDEMFGEDPEDFEEDDLPNVGG
jgi:hypothetical protein